MQTRTSGRVSPGDTVRMKAFARYEQGTAGTDDVVTALASAIAASFGNVSPAGEGSSLAGAFGDALAGGAAIPASSGPDVPKAYLQYILFNKDMSMAQHGHYLVTGEELANWQKLSLQVPVEENGYIYIYVANESTADVDVYFDDMEVQLLDAPVTNASDYYPFGLAMKNRSYSSEPYRFGYQGQFAEKDEETGWNAFKLRMYDPVIGRWMSTDFYGQYWSPYLGMGNNPIIKIDTDGGWSKIGAWWRNGFSMKGVYQAGDGKRMWGFNRETGNVISETGFKETENGYEKFTFYYDESEFYVGKRNFGEGILDY